MDAVAEVEVAEVAEREAGPGRSRRPVLSDAKRRELRLVAAVARAVRDVLDAWERPWWAPSPSLEGACGLAAVLVTRALRRRGVQARPVAGEFWTKGHAWVLLSENWIVDVTVSQFEPHPGQRPLWSRGVSYHPRIPRVLILSPRTHRVERSWSSWRLGSPRRFGAPSIHDFGVYALQGDGADWWTEADCVPPHDRERGSKRVERLLARRGLLPCP